jgi:hypothetical protein
VGIRRQEVTGGEIRRLAAAKRRRALSFMSPLPALHAWVSSGLLSRGFEDELRDFVGL